MKKVNFFLRLESFLSIKKELYTILTLNVLLRYLVFKEQSY
ncbi:hypothetical protein J2Z26_004505 [Bacillus luteolus]|nr:hypothetical protein [Cytobacillus luteolus]